MENKKEILKNVIIVIIIIVVVIYNFVLKKDAVEEYDYSEIVSDENVMENEIIENTKIKVYVTGAVNTPGVIELEEGARIEDAISLAGGVTAQSDLSKVNLAYSLEDGQKLYIPNISENFNEEYITTESIEGVVESTTGSKSKVNINKGGVSELSSLPGVGESLAQKIITYREANGKFEKIDDLKNVTGIGDKKYESLKEYICVK